MQKTTLSPLFILLFISFVVPQTAEAQQGRRRPESKEEIQQRKVEMEMKLKNATTDAEKVEYGSRLGGLVARENFGEGMELAKNALEVAKASEDKALIAKAYFGCGNIAMRGNRNDEALDYFKAGLPYAIEFSDPRTLNSYYYQTANIYDKRGMYEKALYNYQQSLTMLQQMPDAPEIQHATLHLNIGNVLDRTGKHREAIGYYERSVAISEKLERWDMAGGAWHNIAEGWKKLGEETLADEAFTKAEQYMERSKKKAISPPRMRSSGN